MEIALFGATGGTGLHIARAATQRGHRVHALARRSNAALESIEGVRVTYGDARDPDTVRQLLADSESVVSALGLTAAGSSDEKVFVCTDAVGHILDEFDRTRSPQRLIVCSTHGVNDSSDGSPYVERVWQAMGERLTDKQRMEELLFARSDVDWTIVRCPRIVDGQGTGDFRAARALRVGLEESVAREPLAAFIIDQLGPEHLTREVVSVVG